MTVQHDEAIVTAAHTVHDKVWQAHWKEGRTKLRPKEVIEYVRQIRTGADCTEQQLPQSLRDLLAVARGSESTKELVSLSELILPLKDIYLPERAA